MSSAHAERFQRAFGGQMSEGERRFCTETRSLIRLALEGRISFNEAAEKMLVDLRSFRRTGFDVDSALAGGKRLETSLAVESASRAASASSSLTAQEHDFLQDADGFLDFASRNGLTFSFVLQGLLHDLGELKQYGWDFDVAGADLFHPKVTGWFDRNRSPVGESEEGVE